MSAQTAKIDRTPGTWSATDAILSEAGSVFNETGLTPRQLADQRAELLDALDRLVFDLGDLRAAMTNYTPNTAAEIGRAMNRARAAIAKATGEQP